MSLTKSQLELITNLRHRLHAAPELSDSEESTAGQVKEFLAKHTSAKIIEKVGGWGLLAVFEAESEGPTLVFRAELDALPIAETSGVEYESGNKSIAHSCGHDGHMAILCGLALRLDQDPPEKGKVVLLFQPAEETGEGSARVLDDSRFTSLHPDQIIALHNLPGYEKGSIVVKQGVFCAASTGMQIEFEGKTTHAAHQELGISPWQSLREIVEEARTMPNTVFGLGDILKITVVGVNMGGPYFGTAPGNGTIWLTLRAYDTRILKKACEHLENRVKSVATRQSIRHKITYRESFDATENDSELVASFEKGLHESGFKIVQKPEPFSWSEDFGRFTSAYKGFLFGLGAGVEFPPLHASDYDFPDEIIPIGVKAFEAHLRKQLK